MHTPWMFITGCAIVGWVFPEVLRAIRRVNVPVGMNIICAIAGALIAASFIP